MEQGMDWRYFASVGAKEQHLGAAFEAEPGSGKGG